MSKPRIYYTTPLWVVLYPGGTADAAENLARILGLVEDWYRRKIADKAANYREITPHQQAALDAEDEFNNLEDDYPDWYLEYRWGSDN